MHSRDASSCDSYSLVSFFQTTTTVLLLPCGTSKFRIRVDHRSSYGFKRFESCGYDSYEKAQNEMQIFRVAVELGFVRSWIPPAKRVTAASAAAKYLTESQ